MATTLFGFIALGLWLLASFGGTGFALRCALFFVPFGSAAAVNFPEAGLSILCVHAMCALTLAYALIQIITTRRLPGRALSPASAAYLLLTLYGIASAFIAPRLFAGDVLVVPYAEAFEGIRVSEFFYTTLIPLAPSSSNISQPGYLLLGFGTLLVLNSVGKRKGVRFLSDTILGIAAINAVLGLVDAARLDNLLAFVRTADYALAPGWSIGGIDRLIGGFPEPSAFGATSIVLAAYCLSLFFDSSNWRAGILGLLNLILGIFALSTTAYAGLAAFIVWMLLRTFRDLGTRASGRRPLLIAGMIIPLSTLLVILLVGTSIGQKVIELSGPLLFDKLESRSGLERSFWARQGFEVFQQTWWLGAGLGSTRANGLLSALLGNVGLPGLVFFTAFVWLAILRPARGFRRAKPTVRFEASALRAAQAAALTNLAVAGVSSLVVDPGLLFLTFASIAIISRSRLVQAQPSTTGGSARLVRPEILTRPTGVL